MSPLDTSKPSSWLCWGSHSKHSAWPAGKTPSGEMEAALEAVWRLQQGVQESAGRGEAKAAGW